MGGKNDQFRLLRYTHIFASAVREILDTHLLREATPHPLTSSQLQLLRLMSRDGDRMVGQVADVLGVSAPAASKNIDKLEGFGLVERTRSKGDRRATLLRISPAGRALVARYDELAAERLAAVLAGFDPEEIDWFVSLLERFSVSLMDREDTGRGACLRCAAYLDDECPLGRARGSCPHGDLAGATSPGGAEDYV